MQSESRQRLPPDAILSSSMIEEEAVHRARSWVATIATMIVLLFIVVFAWRIVYWIRRIQSPDAFVLDLAYTNAFSREQTVSSLPIPEGEFDLATVDDPSLGSPYAKVTIVEFADFQCPFSKEASNVIRSLARRYGDSIHFVYRDFPIEEIHPLAFKAAQASECAHEQDKFWEYHDKLFQNQIDLSEEIFVQFARELNLNERQFTSCLSSGKYSSEVNEDHAAWVEAGVRGTPTFFINGNRIPGSIPADVFVRIVDQLIARTP